VSENGGKPPRILVTNDDGVRAPGIHVLTQALVDAGRDVVVAAPLDDRSGASAALMARFMDDILYEEVGLERLEGVPVFGIDGPPALAVLASRLGAFGDPPDIIVSGINPGANTGRAVLHSGTVGACLAGANFGLSGLAVSIVPGDPLRWDTAAAVAVAALRWVEEAPRRTVLNVNVPDLPQDQVKGVRVGRLAPFGTVQAALVGQAEGRISMELKAQDQKLDDDTDTMLVLDGYVAVTSIVGPRAVDAGDVADALAKSMKAPLP
jgi:5'-nucleotidase